MKSGQKFFVVTLTVTLPLVGIWTYFARDILTGVAATLGHTLHPLIFFGVAMAVNLAIVHVTLGRIIAEIKSQKRAE